MRILLDHMIPHAMRRHLQGEIFTTRHMGWATLQNGSLLRAAGEAAFDVLVTHDKSMRHQQNLAQHALAVIQLDAPTNQISHLAPLAPRVNEALKHIRPGDYVVIS